MKKKLYINGMCCCSCPNHIREGLSKVDGVTSIEVDSVQNYALVDLDHDIDDPTLKEAVKNAGHYEVTRIEIL